MRSTGQIHLPWWGWGHYAEEKGRGREGESPLPLLGAGRSSIHLLSSASEPLGFQPLDSGPTALGSWRDGGGTGRAGGPRGGSSLAVSQTQHRRAAKRWPCALSGTDGLTREQQGLAGAVQAVGRVCWPLLLPFMAIEWGRMGSVFLEEQPGCGVVKSPLPDHIFYQGSANSTQQETCKLQ